MFKEYIYGIIIIGVVFISYKYYSAQQQIQKLEYNIQISKSNNDKLTSELKSKSHLNT